MCSLECKTFYSWVVWQKCLKNGGCKLAKWGCGYQGKQETRSQTECSVCPAVWNAARVTAAANSDRSCELVLPITTSGSHSASLNVPSNDALGQITWVVLDIPTSRTSCVSYRFACCTSSTFFFERTWKGNLWHLKSGNGKDVFRCGTKAMMTRSRLTLCNTVWSWKPLFGVQGCDWHAPVSMHYQYRQKKISANSEQHKVHDLQTSQSNFIL